MTLWGFPAGAVLGGLVSGRMIAAFGWHSVFIVGGVAPLVLAGFLVRLLPESIRFLASSPTGRGEARKLMDRIAPGQPIDWEGEPGASAASRSGGYSSLFGGDLLSTFVD